MPYRILEPLAEAGALSYLYFHAQSAVAGVGAWELTPERIASTLGLALFVGFYGGKIWRDFLSTRHATESESSMVKRIDENVTEIKMDLIARRAEVNEKINHHSWQIEAIEKNMRQSDSRERKNLRKLEHLETRMSPWLKEFEPEGTRSIAMNFQRIDAEESTDGGSNES